MFAHAEIDRGVGVDLGQGCGGEVACEIDVSKIEPSDKLLEGFYISFRVEMASYEQKPQAWNGFLTEIEDLDDVFNAFIRCNPAYVEEDWKMAF